MILTLGLKVSALIPYTAKPGKRVVTAWIKSINGSNVTISTRQRCDLITVPRDDIFMFMHTK